VKIGDDDITDGLAIPDDLSAVEALIRGDGVRLLVVDPLVAHLPIHIDSHKDQSVRRALAPLYRLAVATDIAVIALLHLNKTNGLAPLARLSGSEHRLLTALFANHVPFDDDGQGELFDADSGSDEPPPWSDDEAADLAHPDAFEFVARIDDESEAAA
jgi:hypothetical protein